jgi:hypothetical protein
VKSHKGLHEYRIASNPCEGIAAKLWAANEAALCDILGDGTYNGRAVPSDRDYEVAATVMQWLGSPVGRNFLVQLVSGINWVQR